MKITLRFFASVRETLGTSQEVVEVPADVETVGALRQHLVARGGAWERALSEQRALRMAYNQTMCDALVRLNDGAEVAFFPPVTGG